MLENAGNEIVICKQILGLINLMSDFGFDTKKLIKDSIYEKLFWGCNLPSVTPKDKYFEPIWEKVEIQEMIDWIWRFPEIVTRIEEVV